jgi:nucleoside-diphosphate-sugar epimerase
MAAKIVVTGGSGRLGRHVIRELMDHGYEILSLDRVAPPTDLCHAQIVDLTHAELPCSTGEKSSRKRT